jgi:integrase
MLRQGLFLFHCSIVLRSCSGITGGDALVRCLLLVRRPGRPGRTPGGCSPTSSARRCTPDYVSRRFRELAKAAGLPVIKFHAARHTAATLALEAGIDIKIVSEQLSHSTTRITQDLYQHIRHQVHADSAEKVVALLPGLKGAKVTGL